jgi:hypothetical protein
MNKGIALYIPFEEEGVRTYILTLPITLLMLHKSFVLLILGPHVA